MKFATSEIKLNTHYRGCYADLLVEELEKWARGNIPDFNVEEFNFCCKKLLPDLTPPRKNNDKT